MHRYVSSVSGHGRRISTWGNTGTAAKPGAASLRTPSPPSATWTQHAAPLLSHKRIPNTVEDEDEHALQRIADDEKRMSDESWGIQKSQVSSCPGESKQDYDGYSPPGSLDRFLSLCSKTVVAMFTQYHRRHR